MLKANYLFIVCHQLCNLMFYKGCDLIDLIDRKRYRKIIQSKFEYFNNTSKTSSSHIIDLM